MDNVGTFLQSIKLGHLTEKFEEQEIQINQLSTLTDDDLKTIGINKLGNRKQILKAVASISKNADDQIKVTKPDSSETDECTENQPSNDNSLENGSDFEQVETNEVFEVLGCITARKKIVQDAVMDIHSKLTELIKHGCFFNDLKDETTEEFGDLNLYLSKCLKENGDGLCPIVVTGETSAGKSSFINLLLGVDILTTSALTCSAAICRIRNSKDKKVCVTSKHGIVDLDIHEYMCAADMKKLLREYVKVKTSEERVQTSDNSLPFVDIWWPIDAIPEDIVIVDTPGMNPDDQDLTEMLYEYLPHALAFVYVINSTNAGGVQNDPLLKISTQIKERMRANGEYYVDTRKAIFICNKWDQVSEDDDDTPEQVYNIILERLRQYWPNLDDKKVFKISVSKNIRISDIMKRYINKNKIYQKSTLKERKERENSSMVPPSVRAILDTIKEKVPSIEKYKRSLRKYQEFLESIQYRISAKIRTTIKTKEELKKTIEFKEEKIKVLQNNIHRVKHTFETDVSNLCKEAAKKIYGQITDPNKKFIWTLEQMPTKGSKRNIQETVDKLVKDVIIKELQVLVTNETKEIAEKFFAPLRKKYDFFNMEIDQLEANTVGNDYFEYERSVGLNLPYASFWKSNYQKNKIEIANERAQFFISALSEKQILRNISESCLPYIQQSLKKFFDKTLPSRIRSIQTTITNIQKDFGTSLTIRKECHRFEKLVKQIYGRINFVYMDVFGEKIINQNRVTNMENITAGGNPCIEIGGVYEPCTAIDLSFEDNSEDRWLFLAEINYLRKLNHTNLHKIHGLSFKKNPNPKKQFYVIVENYDSNLEDEVILRKTIWKDLTRYLTDALKGLNYLHENNFVHKQVQLNNIVIKNDEAKLANIRQRSPNVLRAPEVVKSMDFLYESDIFQFGIVIWECWYHKKASDNISNKDDQFTLPYEDPIPDKELMDIIQQCLNTEPNDRPFSKYIQHAIESSRFDSLFN